MNSCQVALGGGILPCTPIELVTQGSDRGMNSMLRALPRNPGRDAACALVEEERPIFVVTGFPVNGNPETDGPPSAFALIDALRVIGKTVKIASWREALEIFSMAHRDPDSIAVPVEKLGFTKLIEGHAIVTIEVCGRCADGTYRNMHGDDISAQAPRFEDVFGFECW